MTTTNTTRRAVMAGLAAAPVAGPPAITAAAPLSEPLATAIYRHKSALATYNAMPDHETTSDGYNALMAAWNNLTQTPCANDNDLLAKLKYLFMAECDFLECRPDVRCEFGPVLTTLDLHLNGSVAAEGQS